MISFSCPFNLLYEYIWVKMFRFNFVAQFSDFPNFAENMQISAKLSKIEFLFLFFSIFFNARLMPQFMLIPKHIHFLNLVQ